MIKKLSLRLCLLAVIAFASIYFVGSSILNKGIKSGVETFGPRVTQTKVTLDSANISILTGSGSLKGLNVGNPDGYKSEDIFAVGEIDLKVDMSTVFSKVIIIDHIIIRKPEISYEKSLTGSNLKELLKYIEEFSEPKNQNEPTSEDDTGAKKQVVIRKLLIEGGTIYLGALGIGQTLSLPTIEMENIGQEGDQMSPAEVISLVLTKLVQSIGPSITNAGELLREGGQAAVEGATKSVTKALDSTVGNAVDKASEGIKGLFGK
jgi:hypothetical protein